MTNTIKQSAEVKMQKSLEALHHEFGKLRTGRAHPGLLEHVMVPYYGNDAPLHQVANISVADARTLMVTPWEKDLVPAIEKAILTADLGLNPATAGTAIRVPVPPLNEQRRKELIKIVRNEAENARISVRNARRDAIGQVKDMVKDKTISEDEQRRFEDSVQKLTDKYIADIDKLLATKEHDLMEI
jgi:ribosome recycling factor